MKLFTVLGMLGAVAFGAGGPAIAQSAPQWNVTFPIRSGHATQRVVLSNGSLTIDRRFPQNAAHVVIPLATIASVSDPYAQDGAWNIDLKLTKAAILRSTLDIGATDTLKTSDVSLSFLTKDAAASAKTYVLGQVPKA